MTRHLALAVLFAAACSDDAPPGDPPLFPEDYAASYTEVRDCRLSIEHGFIRIRILASPDALAPYRDRLAPFPTGSIVLKEEFDDSDDTCAGEVVKFTVMQRVDTGSAPDDLDWTWQQVDAASFTTETIDVKRCTSCHTRCGVPPTGFSGTCAEP